MNRRVLITGATGTVSTALLDSLDVSSRAVRALVRDRTKAEGLAARGVEVVVGDLDDSSSLAPAFDGVQDLWLLTPAGPRAPENNMNALRAAHSAGVERVVRMSAVGAAHDAPTRNGRLHALSDAELKASPLQWTILKPHFFMQNLLASGSSVAATGRIYMNLGEGSLGMIDARDIGAFAARVLSDDTGRHHGKEYTPTGPESISLSQAAEHLGQALDKEVTYIPVPDEAARDGMIEMGLSAWLAGSLVEYAQAYSRGWGNFTTDDFADVVGREPRSFADFARDHAADFGAQQPVPASS